MRLGSVITALILIGLGVLFLLNNLGLLPVDAWNVLWRLWPVALIALGLAFILGRSHRGEEPGDDPVAEPGLGLGVVPRAPLGPQTDRAVTTEDESLEIPLQDARQAQIEINFGAGDLWVRAGAPSGSLLAGDFRYGVQREARVDKGWAWISLRQPDPGAGRIVPRDIRWDVRLAPNLPLALILHTGANRTQIDLSELWIPELTLETGASQTELTLAQRGQMQVQIKSGAAKISVHIPPKVAARIRGRLVMGSFRVDHRRFLESDAGYESPDFSVAANRVEITVEGGVGQVTID